MTLLDHVSHFQSFVRGHTYTLMTTGNAEDSGQELQFAPKFSLVLRSKRLRITITLASVICVITFLFYGQGSKLNFESLQFPLNRPSHSVDWSRFAYAQYVTNTAYLCNSVMLFETLHRLGSKADRLMMYPSQFHPEPGSDSAESRLLLKAQDEYGVKLMPVEVQYKSVGDPTWAESYTKLLAFNQTQYDRVLSLDSDSTVLQAMDELFHLPPSAVAMPRAYWLKQPNLSSQLVLIQPSVEEFRRIQDEIANTTGFDMEVVNDLYNKDCIVIPHRPYDLLTSEFRSKGPHKNYLGNDYEAWDPEKMLQEAKFLHFSDWPMPKPWLPAPDSVVSEMQPKCRNGSEAGEGDCRDRDMWLGFYSDFRDRRKRVCDMEVR